MTLFGRWATINIVMVLGFPHFDEFTLIIWISKTLCIDGSKYTEHKSTSSPAPSEASAPVLPNPTFKPISQEEMRLTLELLTPAYYRVYNARTELSFTNYLLKTESK